MRRRGLILNADGLDFQASQNALERGSPSERLEVFGEVVGGDESEHVSLKGCQILVVEGFDGCVPNGSVHPLGLAVGSGMIRLCQSVLDAVLEADAVEDLWHEEPSCRPFTVLRWIGERRAIIGEDLVDLKKKMTTT
jgi:hypothetical protein